MRVSFLFTFFTENKPVKQPYQQIQYSITNFTSNRDQTVQMRHKQDKDNISTSPQVRERQPMQDTIRQEGPTYPSAQCAQQGQHINSSRRGLLQDLQ